MTIEFQPDPHTYCLDGKPVPGVTRVLADLLPRPVQAGEWYLERGRAVHACAALIAQGKQFDFDPQIGGQVQAVRRFFSDCSPDVIFVEHRVASAVHNYAGTLDLYARIGGVPAVVDYKASISAATPFQLSAYAIALAETERATEPRRGLAVAIGDDGSYSVQVYDLRRYRAGWLALLAAYNIRREAGVKERNE